MSNEENRMAEKQCIGQHQTFQSCSTLNLLMNIIKECSSPTRHLRAAASGGRVWPSQCCEVGQHQQTLKCIAMSQGGTIAMLALEQ